MAAFILTDRPLAEHAQDTITEAHARIGQYIADLVEDGSVLQVGIGAIPDAVLARLGGKRDLGIHTEMFSDGLEDLYATGAITNRLKAIHPNRIVTSFVSGTRRLFDFVRDNPAVEFHPRRGTLARREADHRDALDRGRRHGVAHRAGVEAGRGRRDRSRARALGRDGIRRGESPRQDAARTR